MPKVRDWEDGGAVKKEVDAQDEINEGYQDYIDEEPDYDYDDSWEYDGCRHGEVYECAVRCSRCGHACEDHSSVSRACHAEAGACECVSYDDRNTIDIMSLSIAGSVGIKKAS